MNKRKEETNITIPLKDFIDSHLNWELHHYRPLNNTLATIIFNITKNNPDYGCYVQWPDDELSPNQTQPILWRYNVWADDYERRKKAKVISDNLREKSFIFAANMKILTVAVMDYCYLSKEAAHVVAHKMLTKGEWKKIAIICETPMCTKMEDIE